MGRKHAVLLLLVLNAAGVSLPRKYKPETGIRLPKDELTLLRESDIDEMPTWNWTDESWIGSKISYDPKLPFPKILYSSPDICNKNHAILVQILTVPSHTAERQRFRQKFPIWTDNRISPSFLVGRINETRDGLSAEEWDAFLLDEAKREKDMIIGDFVDLYSTLSAKTTMGLMHHALYCPNPELRWRMKMDVDVLVNWHQVWQLIKDMDQNGCVDNLKPDYVYPLRDPPRKPKLPKPDVPKPSDVRTPKSPPNRLVRWFDRFLSVKEEKPSKGGKESKGESKGVKDQRIYWPDRDPVWFGQRWSRMPVVHRKGHISCETYLPNLSIFPPYVLGPTYVTNRRFAEKFLQRRLEDRIPVTNEDCLLGLMMNGTHWHPTSIPNWAKRGWISQKSTPKCTPKMRPEECPCDQWTTINRPVPGVEKASLKCLTADSFHGVPEVG